MPYHTYPKIWTTLFDYLMTCFKTAGWDSDRQAWTNSVNPDWMLHSVASNLSLHFALRPVLIKICQAEFIALDERGYQVNIFLFLHKNICCWVLIRSASVRHFLWVPHHLLLWRNKKNIGTVWIKKSALSRAMWIQIIGALFLCLLSLVLLNPDIPCLCNKCRSRIVGFWRSQLIWICTVCH